ncbi:hypothetical protein [Limosilactobacillus vaginalis]|uniref:hypothetical protein n=1 Tax=Limosilactobacillus vaginalis TaxID=1633 RepID=UPI00320A79AF
MDSVLYGIIWFAIALAVLVTMSVVGGWVLIPMILTIVLAFIAGRMRERRKENELKKEKRHAREKD